MNPYQSGYPRASAATAKHWPAKQRFLEVRTTSHGVAVTRLIIRFREEYGRSIASVDP